MNILRFALPMLLIIGLMTDPERSRAQEKQSDATWEDTIAFVEKYAHEISRMRINSHGYKFFFNHTSSGIVSRWKDNRDILAWEGETSDLKGRINVFLRELSSADFSTLGVRLCTTGQDIWVRLDGPGDGKKRERRCYDFIVDDREMRPRLLKAFQHLAYLATERRNDRREASGDPF